MVLSIADYYREYTKLAHDEDFYRISSGMVQGNIEPCIIVLRNYCVVKIKN